MKVWRPWTRVIETDVSIPINSSIFISVEGNSKSLFSKNTLLDQKITDKLGYFLERRGYKIVKENYDYKMKMKYRTERHDKMVSSSYLNSNNSNVNANFNSSGTMSAYGLSAAVAQSISAMASRSSVTSLNTTKTIKAYTHTLTIEIIDKNDGIVWNGESTWDSQNINFHSESNLPIQLLVVNLPKDTEEIPTFIPIDSKKVNNYYTLKAKFSWFSSPAIPYNIQFEDYPYMGYATKVPATIRQSKALYAYVDLLQTSEEALPMGLGSYKNPLYRGLWSKVLVGGRYKNSKTGEVIKILIKLSGDTYGYTVDKCWIANEPEYSDYENKMKIWKKALYDYYDVYEK